MSRAVSTTTIDALIHLSILKMMQKTANSKCKFWTFVPTRNICFIVSGACLGKSEEGSISGEKGCVVPSSKLSIQNLFTDKSAKTILVEWENSAVCPNLEIPI